MTQWAENEFGAAPFGKALVKRLAMSITIQSMAPSKTFFSAACGDQAAVTGYDRMMEHPDTDGFTPEEILSAPGLSAIGNACASRHPSAWSSGHIHSSAVGKT